LPGQGAQPPLRDRQWPGAGHRALPQRRAGSGLPAVGGAPPAEVRSSEQTTADAPRGAGGDGVGGGGRRRLGAPGPGGAGGGGGAARGGGSRQGSPTGGSGSRQGSQTGGGRSGFRPGLGERRDPAKAGRLAEGAGSSGAGRAVTTWGRE